MKSRKEVSEPLAGLEVPEGVGARRLAVGGGRPLAQEAPGSGPQARHGLWGFLRETVTVDGGRSVWLRRALGGNGEGGTHLSNRKIALAESPQDRKDVKK